MSHCVLYVDMILYQLTTSSIVSLHNVALYYTLWVDFSLLTDWTGADEEEEDVNVWEDNWDDDNVEDDFSSQLR